MPQIIKQPRAVDGLDQIFDYIAVQNLNPAAADKFVDELLVRMEAFARQPLMGELREDLGPDVRTFAFRQNNIVLYCLLDEGIDVLRVFHTARDYPRLFHGGPWPRFPSLASVRKMPSGGTVWRSPVTPHHISPLRTPTRPGSASKGCTAPVA